MQPSIVLRDWLWDRMARSMFPTMCADGSIKSSIVEALKAAPRTSRPAQATRLRLAKALKWPQDRQRARIRTPVRPRREVSPSLKARRERWLRLAGGSTVAKWAEQRARPATVRAVRARIWDLL